MSLVRAITTFHLPGPVTIAEGTLLDSADPIVKQCSKLFEPAAADPRVRAVLDATARPGRKR